MTGNLARRTVPKCERGCAEHFLREFGNTAVY